MNCKLWNFFLLLAFICCASSCIVHVNDDDDGLFQCEEGEGEVESFELNIDNFKGIDLKIDGEVFITQGNSRQVLVEGQKNIIDMLELDIRDEVWDIELDDCARKYDDLRIYITMPYIDYLALSGSGEIVSENTIESSELTLRLSGSGRMNLGLNTKSLDARISGSGSIRAEGIADIADFHISGSGELRTFDMESLIGEVRITGSGDVEVRVLDELDVSISGSGDVYYKGYPALNVHISGSGDVINAN